MAKELSDIVIEEISLVDAGANGEAKVVIAKRKGGVCKSCGAKEGVMKDCKDCNGTGMKKTEDGDEDEMPTKVRKILVNIPGAIEEFASAIIAKAALAGGISADPEAASAAASSLKEYLMDQEAILKALEEAEAKLATLAKRADDAEALVAAKDEEIAKLKGAPPASEEDVLKSLPESARELVLKARKEAADAAASAAASAAAIEKMRNEKDEAEAISKAASFKFGDAKVLGPLLSRVAKGKTTAEDATVIEGVLKQAGAMASNSVLLKSLGVDTAVEGDPETLLKAKAEEIRKAKPELSPEAAYSEAMDANPALYNAYIAKRRAPAAA